jgi:hypothetical protein
MIRINQNKGQSLVEAAIILPLFIFLIILIMELVHLYNIKRLTEYAAFCVARQEIVGKKKAKERKNAAVVPLVGISASKNYPDVSSRKEKGSLYDLLKADSPLTPRSYLAFNKKKIFHARIQNTMDRTMVRILDSDNEGVKVQVLYCYEPLFFSESLVDYLWGQDNGLLKSIFAYVNGVSIKKQERAILYHVKKERAKSRKYKFPMIGECFLKKL